MRRVPTDTVPGLPTVYSATARWGARAGILRAEQKRTHISDDEMTPMCQHQETHVLTATPREAHGWLLVARCCLLNAELLVVGRWSLVAGRCGLVTHASAGGPHASRRSSLLAPPAAPTGREMRRLIWLCRSGFRDTGGGDGENRR